MLADWKLQEILKDLNGEPLYVFRFVKKNYFKQDFTGAIYQNGVQLYSLTGDSHYFVCCRFILTFSSKPLPFFHKPHSCDATLRQNCNQAIFTYRTTLPSIFFLPVVKIINWLFYYSNFNQN